MTFLDLILALLCPLVVLAAALVVGRNSSPGPDEISDVVHALIRSKTVERDTKRGATFSGNINGERSSDGKSSFAEYD